MKHNDSNDVIELKEVISALWFGKKIIILFSIIAAISGILYTLNMPDIYRSYAILTPKDNSSAGGSLQGYSGLASMAGIKLPSSGMADKSTEAIYIMASYSFFEENILPNISLPNLMAVESWSKNSNTISYDESIFDNSKGVWHFNNNSSIASKAVKPSSQISFEEFHKKLSVSQDLDTGFVTISIDHQSPYIAQKWVEIIISEINSKFRHDDKLAANLSIEFLNKQIANINFSEIKESLYDLIQAEIKKLSLIESNQDYVFKILEPPIASEKKQSPARAVLVIIISFMGFMIGCASALVFHFNKRN